MQTVSIQMQNKEYIFLKKYDIQSVYFKIQDYEHSVFRMSEIYG